MFVDRRDAATLTLTAVFFFRLTTTKQTQPEAPVGWSRRTWCNSVCAANYVRDTL
jgi:hypothetical protein